MKLWRFKWRRPCSEVGHQFEAVEREGYASGGHYRCVADRVTQTARRCRHCRAVEGEWETTASSCIHSLSMPTEHMDQLEREGFFLTRGPRGLP